ncbi:hypothetical protein JQ604_30015 [Bradyrhizobium jicamae]|uniref:hypothetical protein n=1 Tax=Bradyrhizobium jicamae TaxID=280332 RepID=UPI001BA4A71D|nr:hypothetical protein [Bradyrhizobium jicamae]MBR0756434.1 hypothetical protein [Bradyrhizobium jicamae]
MLLLLSAIMVQAAMLETHRGWDGLVNSWLTAVPLTALKHDWRAHETWRCWIVVFRFSLRLPDAPAAKSRQESGSELKP